MIIDGRKFIIAYNYLTLLTKSGHPHFHSIVPRRLARHILHHAVDALDLVDEAAGGGAEASVWIIAPRKIPSPARPLSDGLFKTPGRCHVVRFTRRLAPSVEADLIIEQSSHIIFREG